MSNLTVFQFEQNEVRFVGTADDPWWVAADVCAVLEMNVSQTRRLDEDEKDLRSVQTLGGKQEMLCVNESGLYSLILGSRKPQAKRFKKWVTSVVLPSIRKTGKYEVESQTVPQPTTQSTQPQLLPTPAEISEVIDLMLGNTDLHKNLIAGAKGNAIARLHPQHTATIEAAKALLSVSVESELVRPTVLGEKLSEITGESWSAVRVNKALLDQGFQIKNPDGKNPAYLPTEKGKEYSQLVLDTARGRDKTIQSLQWHVSVLSALETETFD